MTVRAALLTLVLGLAVVGCGSAATSSPPPSQATLPTSAPSLSAAPTSSPTPAPTPSSTSSPTPAPTSSAAACVVESQTGILPSDRLTNVEILTPPGRDVVRFTFGEGSLEPVGRPTGTLDVAVPPFTEGPSGRPIDLDGDHAVQVVYRGMSLQNDVGQLTYDGPREFEITDPSRSLRHVVLFDESEGQLGWYVGYDAPGCPTLTRVGDTIVLAIEFGPGR